MDIFLLILAALVVAAALIWACRRFYVKATAHSAVVRSGLGGRRAALHGGCLALPFLHRVEEIDMRSMALSSSALGSEALLSADFLPLNAELEIRASVLPTEEGVSSAARSLGSRGLRPESLEAVFGGQILAAMRESASRRSLRECHGDRAAFAEDVRSSLESSFSSHGLRIEASSLRRLEQGAFESREDSDDVFAAAGRREAAAAIAEHRKARAAIETEAEEAVSLSVLERDRVRLETDRRRRQIESAEREEAERAESESSARSARARADSERLAEEAAIERETEVAAARVERDRRLRLLETTSARALDLERIASETALATKRAESASARAAEESSRADVLVAEEEASRRRAMAIAERERAVSSAKAEESAATLRIRAEADRDAAKAEAEAETLRSTARAEGRALMLRAENERSSELVGMEVEMRRLETLPELAAQMVKPAEKIDSIRVTHVGGLSPVGGGTASDGDASDGPFEQAMRAMLGMAARMPAMKRIGEEVGLDLDPRLGVDAVASAARAGARLAPDASEASAEASAESSSEASADTSSEASASPTSPRSSQPEGDSS